MEYSFIYLLVSILIALTIGFLITWKIRGQLRALIVRVIPTKYRFSEKSFSIQGKYHVLVSFLLGIGLAALFLILINFLGGLLGFPLWNAMSSYYSQTEETEVRPMSNQTISTPDTFYLQPTKIAKQESTGSQNEIAENAFFLQLYAFKKEERAWKQKVRWGKKLRQQVLVGYLDNDASPYKVLIGPFADRASVVAYKRRNRLKGFPKEATEIQLYEQ